MTAAREFQTEEEWHAFRDAVWGSDEMHTSLDKVHKQAGEIMHMARKFDGSELAELRDASDLSSEHPYTFGTPERAAARSTIVLATYDAIQYAADSLVDLDAEVSRLRATCAGLLALIELVPTGLEFDEQGPL